MRNLSVYGCVLWLLGSVPVFAQDKKDPSPAEKAAERLGKLLQPGAVSGPPFAKGPASRRALWWIEHPAVPVTIHQGTPPRVALAPIQITKPGNPPEATPLLGYRKDPLLPFAVELPAGYLVRLPSPDVNQPLPLPILAQPHRDRGSLANPSYDASLLAALAQVQALRLLQVPFVPLNLPDPFEHSQAVRLRFPPDEDPQPAPVTPRPPQK